jgi:hypothetical protein
MSVVCFFDSSIIGLRRYAFPISQEVLKLFPDASFYFVYDTANTDEELKFNNLQLTNSKLIFAKSASHSFIYNLLKSISPDVLIVFAQRISDSAYVSCAKNLGIHTSMFQHGMYIPFMKREATIFIENISKTIRYIRYASAVAIASGRSRREYIRDYINVFVKGVNVLNTSIDISKVNVDEVYVYGEYWKIYHQQQFGYSLDCQHIVGYQDLAQVNTIKNLPKENSICYVAQTLVEDGRMAREEFLKFISTLSKAIPKDKKIYLKLHPRTDLSLFTQLINEHSVELCDNVIPHSTCYIGHYSTLIAVVASIGTCLVLWEFPEHPIPTYFKDFSDFYTDSEESLIQYLNSEVLDIDSLVSDRSVKEKTVKYFFDYDNSNDTFKKIAHCINQNIKK